MAGLAGHKPVVEFALAEFAKFVDGKDIEPDLQRSIFQLVRRPNFPLLSARS